MREEGRGVGGEEERRMERKSGRGKRRGREMKRSDGERSGKNKERRRMNFKSQHATNYEVEKRRLFVSMNW